MYFFSHFFHLIQRNYNFFDFVNTLSDTLFAFTCASAIGKLWRTCLGVNILRCIRSELEGHPFSCFEFFDRNLVEMMYLIVFLILLTHEWLLAVVMDIVAILDQIFILFYNGNFYFINIITNAFVIWRVVWNNNATTLSFT